MILDIIKDKKERSWEKININEYLNYKIVLILPYEVNVHIGFEKHENNNAKYRKYELS